MIFTVDFLKGAGERAIRTFAQTLVAYFVVGTSLIGFDWAAALSVSGAAAIASLLTSIGNADFVAGKPNVVAASDDSDEVGVEPLTPEQEDILADAGSVSYEEDDSEDLGAPEDELEYDENADDSEEDVDVVALEPEVEEEETEKVEDKPAVTSANTVQIISADERR